MKGGSVYYCCFGLIYPVKFLPPAVLAGVVKNVIGIVFASCLSWHANRPMNARISRRKVVRKVTWDNSYSVGVAKLDKQHQRLLGMINKLIDHPDATYESEIVSDLLTSMTQYAIEHFQEEEEYMDSINYPELREHRQRHKEFLLKMTSESLLVMQKKEGETDLLEYLINWFTTHIMGADMKYKLFQIEQSGPPLDVRLVARKPGY
jgi:hemerythrin